LWTALNQEFSTHCEETEKRVLCHEGYLWKSTPGTPISFENSPGGVIGVDVVAFCVDLFQELTNVIVEGVDPLVEFLTLAESVVFILVHPFCLDREGKV